MTRGFSIARLVGVFAVFAAFVLVATRMVEREADPAVPQPRATRKVALENAPATIVPGKRRKSETPEIALAKGPLDEDSSLDMAAQVWSRLIPEEELARQARAAR